MVSPELLRRYAFFSFMDQSQLQKTAMISSEINAAARERLIDAGQEANSLYILLNGGADIFYIVQDKLKPEIRQEFPIGPINPGEMIGISALIKPHVYMASIVTTRPSRLLQIDAIQLRDICQADLALCNGFLREVALATKERLQMTRTFLAAATA